MAIPPRVTGCTPGNGGTLDVNRVEFTAVGIYNVGNPRAFDLTRNKPVVMTWQWVVKDVPPPGSRTDTTPGTLTVWLETIEPGHRYQLSLYDFQVELQASASAVTETPEGARWRKPVRMVSRRGSSLRYRQPDNWWHRTLLRLGLRSRDVEERWHWE